LVTFELSPKRRIKKYELRALADAFICGLPGKPIGGLTAQAKNQ